MQCNCGGLTVEHKVTKDLKLVQTFQQCTSCGRVGWRRYFDADLLMNTTEHINKDES